jgi:dihydrofolate reductase
VQADIYIAASLDGLIADEAGKTDWVADDALFEKICRDYGFIAMGYATFTEYGEVPFGELQYIILSGKAAPADLPANVHFAKSALEAVATAEKLGATKLLVIGGGKANQAFLEAKAVGKVLVDVHSLTLGKGTPMFGAYKGALDFELIANEWHEEGFMHAEYALRQPSVISLAKPAVLKELAGDDAYKAGVAIVKAHGVELNGVAPLEVKAKVGELTTNETMHTILTNVQEVTLRAVSGELSWHCTCGRESQCCEHIVATALTARQRKES